MLLIMININKHLLIIYKIYLLFQDNLMLNNFICDIF